MIYKKLLKKFPAFQSPQEGSLKLTQSMAILNHLARRHNLAGGTEEEKTAIDLMTGVAGDIR